MAGERESALLYILRAGHDDLFKIGRTTASLPRRIAQLNTGAACKLSSAASFQISRATACKCEAYVHATLEDLSVQEGGGREFFRCGDEAELCRRVQDACEAFAGFHAKVLGVVTESDAEKVSELFEARRRLAAELKLLEVRKDLIETELKSKFAEGFDKGKTPMLTWEKRSVTRFDLESFKSKYPDLAEQYMTTRSVRVPRFH